MEIRGFKDTISWYNQSAKQYGEVSKTIDFEERIGDFLTRLPPHPHILEAGCGVGRDANVFHEKGAEITAVDISEGLLKVARQENPNIRFVESDFLNLPLEDNSFDGIWAHASLVHLETLQDVKKALSEFRRVLKPRGFLYLYVKKQMGENETEIISDSLSNHERFFRYYQEDQLVALLNEQSFTIEEQKTEDDPHGRPEVKWLQFIAQKPPDKS